MPIKIVVRKLYNTLVPADDAQALEMEKLTANMEYQAIFTQPRNPGFHRKAFALAQIGFDAWEPPEDREYKGRPILKNFESFRNELTIRAGFYDVVWNLKEEMRLRPHSWSWASTDQLKFEQMYSAFIDVILRDILTSYSKEDLEETVNKVLGFA